MRAAPTHLVHEVRLEGDHADLEPLLEEPVVELARLLRHHVLEPVVRAVRDVERRARGGPVGSGVEVVGVGAEVRRVQLQRDVDGLLHLRDRQRELAAVEPAVHAPGVDAPRSWVVGVVAGAAAGGGGDLRLEAVAGGGGGVDGGRATALEGKVVVES